MFRKGATEIDENNRRQRSGRQYIMNTYLRKLDFNSSSNSSFFSHYISLTGLKSYSRFSRLVQETLRVVYHDAVQMSKFFYTS